MGSRLIATLAVCTVLAGGCEDGQDTRPADALVEVHEFGCVFCDSRPGDIIHFDQTTTVSEEGEVSGHARPQTAGSVEFEGYEFDGYRLTPNEFEQLTSALAEIDLAAMAGQHPPVDEKDSHITNAITYDGSTYEIGDPVGEDYDDPPRQAALFGEAMQIVEDARLKGSGVLKELEKIPTIHDALRAGRGRE